MTQIMMATVRHVTSTLGLAEGVNENSMVRNQ